MIKVSQKSLFRKLQYLAWLGLIFLVVAVCIKKLYLFPGVSEILTSADMIQLPTLFLDLQADLNNFWHWQLPDAPYYFPDTLVFLLINYLVQDLPWSILLYSWAQSLGLIIGLSWIYFELGGKKIQFFWTILLGSLLLFSLAYTVLFDEVAVNLVTPYVFSLVSYIHFGTYLCYVFCFAACLKYYRTPQKYLAGAIVCVTLITTASDLLFAVTFTIPLILTIAICSWNRLISSKKHQVFLTALFVASLVGYIYNKYFDPLGATASIKLKPTKAITSIESLLNNLWQMPGEQKVFMSLTILLPLCYLLWQLKAARTRINSAAGNDLNDPNLSSLVASLFVLISCATNLAVVIIVGKYTGVSRARYLITLYYMPGMMALLLLALQFERGRIKSQASITLATATAIGVTAWSVLLGQQAPVLSKIVPPDYAKCFDLEQPQAGLADYWYTKPLIAFSQRRIQIATINDQGEPYTWNSNRNWYRDSWQNPGSPPMFKFIIMANLNPEAITRLYGQPKQTEVCSNTEIWWYDDQQKIYDNLMRDGL
ncbi:MAG: hypothetical protein AAGM46_06360 [Cyanobacteria bacterium J06582_2]